MRRDLPRRRRGRRLRPARRARSPARTAPGGSTIAPQAVDNAFWSAPAGRARAPPRAVHGALRRPRGPGKGVPELLAAWRGAALDPAEAALVLAGDGHEARSGRAGSVAGASARNCATSTPARRCGRTVGPHAPLPRAVGARRQRGHEPGTRRHRHRRRRRRRRRPGPPRAQRARRARGRRAALGARDPALHDDPALRDAARRGRRAQDVAAYTYEAWAAGFAAAWLPRPPRGGALA